MYVSPLKPSIPSDLLKWPNNGEIDIIEGVNQQLTNAMALHTAQAVQIQGENFAGSVIASNCAIDAPDQAENQGCGIEDPSPLTYGNGFNEAGGGVFAVEWTSEKITMWFFPRGKFPDDIVHSQPSPNPTWGPPRSVFAGQFNMDEHFSEQRIVFDTTFCGSVSIAAPFLIPTANNSPVGWSCVRSVKLCFPRSYMQRFCVEQPRSLR